MINISTCSFGREDIVASSDCECVVIDDHGNGDSVAADEDQSRCVDGYPSGPGGLVGHHEELRIPDCSRKRKGKLDVDVGLGAFEGS